MLERIPLTKAMAAELLKARKAAGISQYALADELGWVRSKVKRLELGEVESIAKKDYDALMGLLKGVTPKNGARKAPETVAAPRKPRRKAVQGSQLFDSVNPITNRRSKLKFFRVRLARDTMLEDLLSQMIALKDVRGTINGVEHHQSQGPEFKKGEKVVIAIYPS